MREYAPDAPDRLVAICKQAMETNPANRFPTALALREALEEEIPKDATPGALGLFVSESFASRRESIRGSIHDYLEQSEQHESLPMLRMSDGSGSTKLVIEDSSNPSRMAQLVPNDPQPKPKRRMLALAAGTVLLGSVAMVWVATRGDVGSALPAVDSAVPPPVETVALAGSQPAAPASVEDVKVEAGVQDAEAKRDAEAPENVAPQPSRGHRVGTRPTPTSTTPKDPTKKIGSEDEGKGPVEGADLAGPKDKGSRPIFEDDPYAK